ncbi:hypothetical protein [Salinibaculum rarum]|uniref:hypothetical protein n=1 Tax=Salinibaculum rarum TaxID=3058903 RepID=UPI00265DF57A|nr:hypothetical protein [Salinibaculum sp. KK48]
MSRGADECQADDLSAGDALVAAYRHDVHKLRGRRHDAAADEYAGVAVNETVPRGADQDAALLSRPRGEPEQTVDNHASPYRLSLLTGETAVTRERIRAATGGGFQALVTPTDSEELHARWLTSDVPNAFNEAVYYPYTSAKYHTLLVGALLDNYRAGHAFDDLFLVATTPGEAATTGGSVDASAALTADVVEPHRTVLWTPEIALHVTGAPGDRPAARLGAVPARSFADVWSRLPAHPLDVDGQRRWRVLDAQLRRVRSWSAALAFVEEFVAAFGADPEGVEQSRRGGRESSGVDSAW